ncbi:hypothetical protein P9112_006165 [Eukaryota sp. TZLM1-RC]
MPQFAKQSANEKAKAYDKQRRLMLQRNVTFNDDLSNASASDLLCSYLDTLDDGNNFDDQSPSLQAYLEPEEDHYTDYFHDEDFKSDTKSDVKSLIEDFLSSSSHSPTLPHTADVADDDDDVPMPRVSNSSLFPPKPAPSLNQTPPLQSIIRRKPLPSSTTIKPLPSKTMNELRKPPKLKNNNHSKFNSNPNFNPNFNLVQIDKCVQTITLGSIPSPEPLSPSISDDVTFDDVACDDVIGTRVNNSSLNSPSCSPLNIAMLRLQEQIKGMLNG